MGIRGRFIVIAAATFGVAFLGFILFYVLFGTVPALIVAVTTGGSGLLAIYIKQKNYLGAEALLKKIEESHGGELLGDDAVFKLAELYEYYLKDIPKAMEYYMKVIQNYSSSLYVIEARKRYRALRGDTIE